MTVTIPATVTNLQDAFRGCTTLTSVTLEHTHNALVDGTVTMTNAFYGCTNLATVYCHNAPAISETTWHAFRIKSNGDVNVFNGTEWRPRETPVSLSGEIEATKKTNLVSFGDFTDTQIADMMTNGKSFTSDDHALDPTAKNFVLWGADGTNFETNLPLGGGGSAGDGISISGGYISQTTDQLTFTGTQAQWEALTSAEKAKYGLVNITDDEESKVIDDNTTSTSKTWSSKKINNTINEFAFMGTNTYDVWTSSNYDYSVAHSLTKHLTLPRGLYKIGGMVRNVTAGVVSNSLTLQVASHTILNLWNTSSAGWSNTNDCVILPIGQTLNCDINVSQPVGFQYEVYITRII